MVNKFLEAGKIVNTHGVCGEVRIQPWADSPGFLAGLECLYVDGEPIKVLSAKVHKSFVIATLDGISDINKAMELKNKVVFIDRDDVQLDEGRYFIADILGLRAIDSETGEELGVVADVLSLPANDVYVIKGVREMLVPAVPAFIADTNIDMGLIKLRLIEGL